MLSTLEWLTCFVLVLVLASLERGLLVVEYMLLAPAFVVASIRAALGAVCGELWEKVYP